MKKLINAPIFVFIASVLSSVVLGQDLNLFQAIESDGDNADTVRRPQREQQNPANPAFTLVGTSRFGERYLVSLLARNGTSVVVEWEPGDITEIKGHLNYSIANVSGRKASIRYPESEPCVANEAKGVQCVAGLAVLSLSNAEPLEAQVEPVTNVAAVEEDVTISAENTADGQPADTVTRFRNPFTGEMQEVPQLTPEEQAEREARRQERAAQFRNFEIVRIPDDEIPEGMRRVRTPFGDSLEPIEE